MTANAWPLAVALVLVGALVLSLELRRARRTRADAARWPTLQAWRISYDKDRAMTREKAIKLAIEALQAQRHTHAPTANLRRMAGVDTPATQLATQRYDELSTAIGVLEQLASEPIQTRML